MALFSIITVTYNNAEGLRKTATSVLAQTYDDYEWIVIDGGSADGTADFLGGTDAQWISEADHGIYDAMNKGLARATGDYVIFMNAGDLFAAAETLARIKLAIENAATKPDFIYGDALEDQGRHNPSIFKPARNHAQWRYGMFTHHQAMIYRRAALTASGLCYDTTYSIAADYKLTIQLIGNYRNTLYLKGIPLCLFESGGISQINVRQGRKEQFAIRKEHGCTPLWQNILIYTLQTMVWNIRRICPKLYWMIKTRA